MKIQELSQSLKSTTIIKNLVSKQLLWEHLSATLVCNLILCNRNCSTTQTVFFSCSGEIKALAGCDLLTISPKLLGELEISTENLPKVLGPWSIKKIYYN